MESKKELQDKYFELTGKAADAAWTVKQLKAEIAKVAPQENNQSADYFKSAILNQRPPERVEALISNEWPQLMGEFLPVASFPYNPTDKHILSVTNDEMTTEEKKAAVMSLASDSLIRFKIKNSNDEFIFFASALQAAAKKANIEPFITLPSGKIAIKKGLKCKIQPKKFALV